ncbi:MAG: tRNA uridine-5-carboxymethylaminomethyl(34) synthesis enzyme MnmG [Spirochaetales bacterium]|uniref:tRNA uridine-5-carboxymethylaminomethyl(34) synthesis enzyme MnmG n=1 Tax=Bullifex sp. TaxID=2815808 RepID=UPI002A5607FA|nr:tRNA uridine-5-carboxymethylaminomethyl(34) synthesis enzyme MnmG [Bullifex sp.]MDD7271578.1 tRNA uridine-5-carboxymethylaminomethyl(34) synthesis enzyme MnmG [Spirochaetales bacterium]MDY4067897.1 tRNA uridine-5-carboxymethylaminomethyl(34) synthesis enzyme MnmG [Bullifex sp.]
MRDYDIIVIGGGHAGIEAASAAARQGFDTLMITQSLDAIGRLSCNPAIGGLAKGNLVREIDALGGLMGHLIDDTFIQFRILNKRRGPAVQAPRAQADKFSYSRLAKETLEKTDHLSLFMDTVTDLLIEDNKCIGVVTERGWHISSRAVVLTTGTFMNGRIFIGEYDAPCGRLGEMAAVGLGDNLRKLGFNVGRMKTGTPARVRKSSLDFDELEIQPGDEEIIPFSFDNDEIIRSQLPCYVTWTNDETHKIIRDNIHRSPLYGGKIVGKGPRYCPSIEDKVVRFPERERHQIFVEPEGNGTEEMYLNGLSSSLPEEVQHKFIRTLPGLKHCEIMRPAYAVEYDYIDPTGLYPSLESKRLENLFIAGQTNGTSGYEEAAAQGLIAGINAALKLRGEDPLILKRTEAYIGVLIDDLVTKGTKEPYRMFTSRAEYRLSLRHDNADMRLTRLAYEKHSVSDEKLERLNDKINKMDSLKTLIKSYKERGKNGLDLLKEPEVDIIYLESKVPAIKEYSLSVKREVELDIKYAGYLKRQETEASKFDKSEKILIPDDINYDLIDGLSSESREKFKAIKPQNVGQAMRISGVRVSDAALLMMYLKTRGEHGSTN